LRKSIFEKNSNFNSFADLTHDEFLRKKTGLITQNDTLRLIRSPSKPRLKRDSFFLPKYKGNKSCLKNFCKN
jgi:hypothetical protein